MKKRSALLLCMFLTISVAHATHIIGGSMFHQYIGNNTWRIQLDMYRDCDTGEPYFDSFAAIGVFDETGELVQSTSATFDPMLDDTFNLVNVPVCFPLPYPVCVHRGRYFFELTLPDTPGKTYRVVYQRCCRNRLVQNIDDPLATGMTFMTTITPSDHNSSAKLHNPLPFYAFVNTPFTYDAGATDADGDSLVYRLSAPVKGADLISAQPNPPSLSTYANLPYSAGFGVDKILGDSPQPLTIHPITGEMTAIPNLLGYFVIGYDIDEIRNGVVIASNHHEIMLVVNDGNYEPYIGGAPYIDQTHVALDSADIHLIQRNPITDSLVLIANMPLNDGKYVFSDVFTSKYYVRATPTPGSAFYTATFPTYYPSAYFWYNAQEIEVCNYSRPDIDVALRTDTLQFLVNVRPCYIKGKLLAPDTQLPIPDYEMWLMGGVEPDLKPLKWTKTDQDGNFAFKSLPAGNFQIYANELNSGIYNKFPPQFQLSVSNSLAIDVTLERLTDRLAIKSKEVLISKNNLQFVVTPNPVSDEIHFESSFHSVAAVKIFDVSGKLLQTENVAKFSVKNLPQGIYWAKIETLNGIQTIKFVKI